MAGVGPVVPRSADGQRLAAGAGRRGSAAPGLRAGRPGPDLGQRIAGPLRLPGERRGQGAAGAAPFQRQPQGVGRAGDRRRRLRPGFRRENPTAVSAQPGGQGLVRRSGDRGDHRNSQRHAAGRLSDAGGPRPRARLRPDVGLRPARGRPGILSRRPLGDELPVRPGMGRARRCRAFRAWISKTPAGCSSGGPKTWSPPRPAPAVPELRGCAD